MEIWDEVIKAYNEELNRLKMLLGNGTAESYSHYRELVGHVRGIEWARELFTTVVKNRIYEEEE